MLPAISSVKLTDRPRLLALHERHMGLVGSLGLSDNQVHEPNWLATLAGSTTTSHTDYYY